MSERDSQTDNTITSKDTIFINNMAPPPPVQMSMRPPSISSAAGVPPASTPSPGKYSACSAKVTQDLQGMSSTALEEDQNGDGGGSSSPAIPYHCDNRVRVICRFRECLGDYDDHDGNDGLREAAESRRISNQMWSGDGEWLYFDDNLEEGRGAGEGMPETVSVRMGSAWSRRAFDRVFKPGVGQREVFDAVKQVAHGVAQGFNGTIFAYGQTGSGKTYTMGGAANDSAYLWSQQKSSDCDGQGSSCAFTSSADDAAGAWLDGGDGDSFASEAGVIPRAVASVLADANARRAQGWEYVLTATYVEIYNERVRDLLNPSNDNLKVSEHPARGVEASGASEVRVSTVEEAVGVLREGVRHRMTAATLMNQNSSRSHSIFTLRLDQRDVVRDCKVAARLTLVDLAGSERAAKTRAEGKRLEEANSINVSLHTLGRVIRALSESASHVPFRDSKLTRLLQESLGGNSRTVLIVCCSPEESQAKETLSTLKFGECAKRVTTFASANVVAAPNEVAAQLSQLRGEMVRLKRQNHDLESQLREARRVLGPPSAVNRRPRRASASRAGFDSPGAAAMFSPNGCRAPRSARASRGHGSGLLKRWSASSPLSRTVSFNASYPMDDVGASSDDDESWGGATPREWEQDVITTWSASAAAEAPSPSSAIVGRTPTRWKVTARLEPPESPLVVMAMTPTLSPDATPVSTGRRRKSMQPAGAVAAAAYQGTKVLGRMWEDSEGLPNKDLQEQQPVDGNPPPGQGTDMSVRAGVSQSSAAELGLEGVEGVSSDEGATVAEKALLERVEHLERNWMQMTKEYEKHLQLKDLRIQSLTSVYQNCSASFREAVNAKALHHHDDDQQYKGKDKPTLSPTTTNSPTIDSDNMPGDENNHAPMHGGNGASGICEVSNGSMANDGGSSKRVSRRRTGRGREGGRGTELFGMISAPPPAPPSSPLPLKRYN